MTSSSTKPLTSRHLSTTSALRKEVQRSLWPFVERAGFSRAASTPFFTTFRRDADDAIHVFDVQWDKYHRPRFVINFAAAPRANGLSEGRVVDDGHIEVHDCPDMLRLQRYHGGSRSSWFQLRKPFLEGLRTWSWNYSPEIVVATAISHFQELEEWWKTRKVGPHVRIIRSAR